MSGDSSEEKKLPASQRKLRKAREKGQVVTSREAVLSLTGIAGLLYLYAVREGIAEKLMALWELEIDEGDRGFATALQDKLGILTELAMLVVVPFFGLVIGVGILAGMIVTGGPVFSTQPLAPDFDRINPASGFKRIFSLKALLGFLMHLLRLALLAGVLGLVLVGAWGAMIVSPACGFGCVTATLSATLLPLTVGAVAVMGSMAAFDYLVQRRNFMEDQKMTQTEFKREMKDMTGDPHLRGQMRSERRQMSQVRTGAKHAVVVIAAPPHLSVGVRYVAGETPAPVIVAKARGTAGMRRLAAASDAPEVVDPRLAVELSRVAVGGFVIDEDAIKRLVPHLSQALAARP